MSASVEDMAIRWAVRLDADALDSASRRELDDWLRLDDRHRGALFRAQVGLELIDTVSAESDTPSPEAPAQSVGFVHRHRRFFAAGGIAACFAGLLVLSFPLPSGQHYRTQVGEIRRVSLSDGSVAMVNAGSDLRVRYEKTARQLSLDEGEAWFKVAHNLERPFVVDVDGIHVRATGTAFSVRRRAGTVEVVVTEGSVLVWSDERPHESVSVSAGHTALIDTALEAPRARIAANSQRDALAWRQGGVSLNETSVFDAAEEFNRYNLVQIEVTDARIGKQLMTGYFQIDRPEEFSQAVAEVTGARLSNDGNKIVIN